MPDQVKEHMTAMPHSIRTDMSLVNAREMMEKHSCHHLPVLSGGVLVGIISTTDLKRVKRLPNSDQFKVEDVMTDEPVVVKPTDDIFQVSMLMYQENIGSVIVSGDSDKSWGIFTSTDALGCLSKK